MYFKSRVAAGVQLAEQLMKYRFDNVATLALDTGGVRVGYQIAANLHCVLNELLSEPITLEGEDLLYATVLPDGVVAKNPELSEAEQEYYYGEFQGEIDNDVREASMRINRMMGDGGELNAAALRNHVVILVSDGLKSGDILEAAVQFLKPVRLERLVIATPIASVDAVDKMHILADELHVLGVTPNYIDTAHYYETNDLPTDEQARVLIQHAILGWQ
jgi:predicted phosphoribosyltransferase